MDTPRKRIGIWRAACLLLMLAACALKPADDAAVRRVFDRVRAGDSAGVAAQFAPESRSPELVAQLEAVHDMLPATAATSVRTLNWSKFAGADGATTINAIQEYAYPDRVLLVQTEITFSARAASPVVHGFLVRELTPEEARGTRFTLRGKSPLHYTVLAFLGFSVALMAASIIATLRARNFRRKWLWCIVSVVTVSGLSLNWNTGALALLANVGLINAGVMRGANPLAPWTVFAGLPLGAVIVFVLLSVRPRAP